MRFTPAPWRVQKFSELADTAAPWRVEKFSTLNYMITAQGDGIERELAAVYVSEANANLIAAAPEMYNFLSTLPWGQLTPEQVERLGPILGKARGWWKDDENVGSDS